ncbi:GNAT family N-acetyltransferase [Qaidamihabitans albus]|uniref:GNAT family N-acetyltransferase n=1 Tax=Qaidamihabitans albus TaxID=2795733 RepID=UPI0018F23F8F|nr:GNAT family N-acetyltransferase [Qaidamihabitans albus]
MRFREARPGDWAVIWPLVRQVAATGETYTLPRNLGEDDARAIWMVDPPGRTVVAVEEDGTVIASAKLGHNQRGPGAHVANASFMVAPGHAGRGVGRALGEHVLDLARADGYLAMQFNAVVETNTRAVALWRSLGFEIIATVPEGFEHPVHGYVGLHIMYRTL